MPSLRIWRTRGPTIAALGLVGTACVCFSPVFFLPTPLPAHTSVSYHPNQPPTKGLSGLRAANTSCSGCGIFAGGFAAVLAFTIGRTRLQHSHRNLVRRAAGAIAGTGVNLKQAAGYKAVDDYVRSGTVIGLGTGSTAFFAVERVGQKLKSGELRDIIAIPTSIRTKEQAEALGIPLATLDTHSNLDVAIDGADAVDPDLNLVKGGGGALFREKIVEKCAKRFVVIVDDSKLCDGLGPSFPIPVEIVPFCHEHTMRQIAKLPALKGCHPVLRIGNVANNKIDGDKAAVTDNGNYVVDLVFTTPLKDPAAAAEQLKGLVGVVDHGLFIGMVSACIVAGKSGIAIKEP